MTFGECLQAIAGANVTCVFPSILFIASHQNYRLCCISLFCSVRERKWGDLEVDFKRSPVLEGTHPERFISKNEPIPGVVLIFSSFCAGMADFKTGTTSTSFQIKLKLWHQEELQRFFSTAACLGTWRGKRSTFKSKWKNSLSFPRTLQSSSSR